MTGVAALAAVVAGGFAWTAYRAESESRRLAEKSYQADRDREQRELEEKKRAQAELVSAWGVAEGDGVAICVQNLSASPVYNMRLGLFVRKGECRYAGWVRVMPPTSAGARGVDVKPDALDAWAEADGSRKRVPTPLVEFTFRDAAGRWWWRDENGVLTEIDESRKYRYEKPETVTVP